MHQQIKINVAAMKNKPGLKASIKMLIITSMVAAIGFFIVHCPACTFGRPFAGHLPHCNP